MKETESQRYTTQCYTLFCHLVFLGGSEAGKASWNVQTWAERTNLYIYTTLSFSSAAHLKTRKNYGPQTNLRESVHWSDALNYNNYQHFFSTVIFAFSFVVRQGSDLLRWDLLRSDLLRLRLLSDLLRLRFILKLQ
jgi:hypothetical protein